jgi:hypothetical protein
MVNNVFQIAIEKLDNIISNCEMFKNMNFLRGKCYWEFITDDEKKLLLPKNPTQQQIQANKTWNEKFRIILY